ncbi:MAG: CPBP family intramembrane metalloprotease [Anaeromicrobium sp.]|jgi:membrane protease YdiL (CAAX protease family)|uniref:CPBP family intramembrane glutamic endopeptidase n=1 Tax=Anaeromicrobium sp. TaxID=1929132 RepID=UPI002600C7A2|nr:CPBP family intramembrane glutamic endopeptidase [Anaeromicrobium sp.]MCT4595131.1 CPBP family intramembrane metalloprotease [Anaeromicrobium sp.]
MIKERISTLEIVMVSLCIFVIAWISDNSILAMIEPLVWIIPVFFIQWQSACDRLAYKYDKRMINAFFVVFIVYVVIQLYWRFFTPYHEYTELGVVHLISTLPIFLAYLFKVKLSDLNWNITIKNIVFVVIMFVILREIPIFVAMGRGKEIFADITSLGFIKSFVIHLLYPSIVEEVIFRGYLLTGLISIGFKEDVSNVIQSLIFGFIHIIGKGELSVYIAMSCFVQVYIGFIFGRIYLNTKSLTPSLLLHALFDAYSVM